jgi:hypothetical protein
MFWQRDGNVVMHGFHLHPFATLMDRHLTFKGCTIDTDFGLDLPRECVHVVTDAHEAAFAEMSPPDHNAKTYQVANSIPSIASWATRCANPLHRWMYGHRIVIQGVDADIGDTAVVNSILQASSPQGAPPRGPIPPRSSGLRPHPFARPPRIPPPPQRPFPIRQGRPNLALDPGHVAIVIPAWGERCVETANKYVIPSVLAALQHANKTAKFIIYTDRPDQFHQVRTHFFRPVPPGKTPFDSLTRAHKQTIAEVPHGRVVALLNADIVVSKELFAIGDAAFEKGYKIVSSVGVRTLMHADTMPPPVGGTAEEVRTWAWANRHPLVETCIYGRSNGAFPVALYFEKDGNVVLHCGHQHPFLMLKDNREIRFIGTIDDDLVARYADNEIYYPSNGELGFAELSPHANGPLAPAMSEPITVQSMWNFGANFIAAHIRNFRVPLRILGDGDAGDEDVSRIADGMGRRWGLAKVAA